MTSPADPPSPAELPPPPVFAGARLTAAQLDPLVEYGQILATDGVVRGMIGPREVPRLWERHLLNCAALAEIIPPRARLADIGTGAGLPGVVLALVRPDLAVILIDPLQRRCEFLAEVIDRLRLRRRVTLVRGRAEQVKPLGADVVTSRAVAGFDKLAPWCLPHARIGGQMLAMKGERAAEELAAARPQLRPWGADEDAHVMTCGHGWIEPPVRVVRATRRK